MKVSPTTPFQIVYALYHHEYLGALFESFAVQKDEEGRLTLRYQNISSRNAQAFATEMDEDDFRLIRWMDQLQQDEIIRKFHHSRVKPATFFPKIYHPEKGDKAVREAIERYIQERMGKILEVLKHKQGSAFVMGKDGTPIQEALTIEQEPATILFHFFKNENNTHYYPTIKHKGKKLDFRTPESMVVCYEPAWLLAGDRLYHFREKINGQKLKPFVRKKFILIPQHTEAQYYRRFVAPLIANHQVHTHGFEVVDIRKKPEPQLVLSLLPEKSYALFGDEEKQKETGGEILFQLVFRYGDFVPKTHISEHPVVVRLAEEEGSYTFYRIHRVPRLEEEIEQWLKKQGLDLQKGRAIQRKGLAFSWLGKVREQLAERGIELLQERSQEESPSYFLGRSQLNLEVKEGRDWFDIHAKVLFGDYEIPFLTLRKLILSGQQEFKLPNGELAVIPEEWFTQYSELFSFIEIEKDAPHLKKHHVSLVQDLENGNRAKVSMDKKLAGLRDFREIEPQALPEHFKGTLRAYQKAGYDWMQFLRTYHFGGCLADDMGLGKTVQTLALLQSQREENELYTSLLVVPTSLIHNWLMEAKKFTPKLKLLRYTGTDRYKSTEHFSYYDVIITSYGIIRRDIEILKNFHFHYAILDESQSIKNPGSATTQAVQEIRAGNRLILTGTPIENSTLDLWSQMSFINPGLLGSQRFFKKNFQLPIEKKQDEAKKQRLYSLIKPFILRRSKSQVAKELPDKIENVQYCTMTEKQRKFYEKAKSYYRNQILEHIETQGFKRSQIILLQGLTKLRLIANNPAMTDETYDPKDSGKFEDIIYKLESVLSEQHKVLVFSQFVKHLTLVKDALKARKVNFAYLDGSTRNREQEVKQFQEQEDCRVFLLSLKAGGVGLNLTAADYVFVLDPWWNPAIEAQAVDRAHRIGQENRVFIYKFITQDTVEEKILALQNEKRQLATDLITTEDSFIKTLSEQDIQQLLD